MPRRPISQQRFAAIARQMYDDPELTGEVLTFALALAESLTRFEAPGSGSKWPSQIAERVYGQPRADWARSAIRQDLPRHVPAGGGTTCEGTMVRRDGPCGKRSTRRHWLRDALTGEITVVGSCSRHHQEVEQREHESRGAWVAAGQRPGPQNAGGVLERYFSTDWDKVYVWAMPSWKRPGSALEPARRPHLTLIVGGLEAAES